MRGCGPHGIPPKRGNCRRFAPEITEVALPTSRVSYGASVLALATVVLKRMPSRLDGNQRMMVAADLSGEYASAYVREDKPVKGAASASIDLLCPAHGSPNAVSPDTRKEFKNNVKGKIAEVSRA